MATQRKIATKKRLLIWLGGLGLGIILVASGILSGADGLMREYGVVLMGGIPHNAYAKLEFHTEMEYRRGMFDTCLSLEVYIFSIPESEAVVDCNVLVWKNGERWYDEPSPRFENYPARESG